MRLWLARRLQGRGDSRRLAAVLFWLSCLVRRPCLHPAARGLRRWQRQWIICSSAWAQRAQPPVTVYDVLLVPGFGRRARGSWDLRDALPCR